MTKDVKRALILFLISVPVIIAGAMLKILALPLSGILLAAGLILQTSAVVYFIYLVLFRKAQKENSGQ